MIQPTELKTCVICKDKKPVSEYYRHSRKGTLHAYCKPCYSEYSRLKYHEGVKRPRKPPVAGELHQCTRCLKTMEVNTDNFYHYEGRGWVTMCKPCYSYSKKVQQHEDKVKWGIR